ncbi:conjugal transfer protein TraO [Chryseobacterium tructae]|nr:conjugal transfer protein TraO [Chryseobacterium tructae]MDN3692290.1 conjugal transfer protein TraO [Chryseobacterium tructae]
MKKYIYTVMLLLMTITVTQAQRMLPKQKGLEASAGVLSDDKIGNDYYLNIGMTVNGKNGNYQIWALEYTHQYHDYKTLRIPQEIYTAEGGYSLFLLGDSRKNITLNAGIMGVVGYESINRGEAMLYDGAK